MPVISTVRNVNYTATVTTASATFPEAIQSARDNFTLLDTYMNTLTLDQYYLFTEPKSITNLGTGGAVAWGYTANTRNDLGSGIQGHGALRTTGGTDGNVYAIGNTSYSTELTDDDFSMGFWVKKSTTEFARIYQATSTGGADYFTISFTDEGYLQVVTNLQNQNRAAVTTTSYTDGNWHYVAIRLSGRTLTLYVDNVSRGTIDIHNKTMSTFTVAGFGLGIFSRTELMYISHFYIASSANVTTTEIANIWNYGNNNPVQGSAALAMPKFSRASALNEYIISKSPAFYFEMDEGSGTPQNIGSVTADTVLTGSNYTQNVTSPNYKAYNFTNRDTQFTGSWTAATGTFSSANQQTIALYAKFDTAGENTLCSSGGGGGPAYNGLQLTHLANGTVRLRITSGAVNEDATTTATFADGNYHMFVGVKNGSSLKLYVDGIERASNASSTLTLSDSGLLAIGGRPTTQGTQSRNLTIDEFAILPTAFTLQDAFEAYQKVALIQGTTATALMVEPTTSLGFGPTINPGVGYATALLVDPTQTDQIVQLPTPMTAFAEPRHPNFAAYMNVDYDPAAMTASGIFHMPQFNIGEVNSADHMNASASFPEAYAQVPGRWNASPMIGIPAIMVDPAISVTKGALIKPQSLNAKAMMPIPPAYFTLFDDLWFNRLYNLDKETTNSADFGFLHFFTQSSNLSRSSYLAESGYDEATGIQSVVTTKFFADPAVNENASPVPAGIVGYLDAQNRKAIRLRNISFLGSTTNTRYPGFTLETMIKTTKSNQVLFKGEFSGTSSTGLDAIYLKDGKLAWTTTLGYGGSLSAALSRTPLLLGNKNIADGEWHHIIIQNVQADQPDDLQNGRTQIWIDGQLDIQRYGLGMFRPSYIGANSGEETIASDFFISGISINAVSLVQEREVALNYWAAINHIPFEATPATASALMTDNNKARGNRGRALMLYFWPTFNPSSGFYRQDFANPFRLSEYGLTNADQGLADDLDQDTFFGLTTWAKNMPDKFYDWDIFPLPVTGHSDLAYTFLEDGITIDPSWKHPLIKDGIIKTGTTRGVVYVDPVTDNYRYLDVMNDIKDLSQFDMICFRNYPDQSGERDVYGTTSLGVVDKYFNIQDKYLYENFLKSLRDAVDTGISLFITNPQLAIDLGFIDGYEKVSDLDGVGGPIGGGDTYAPKKAGDPLNVGLPALDYPDKNVSGFPLDYYNDTYKNNYHRVVNTLPGLTDDASYIWTDHIFYNVDGNREYGALERWWDRYEYKPNGLAVGDKFIIADERATASYYAAVPFDKIKAGKVITAFDSTYRHGLTELANPYANYATTIAVEPGTVVAGKQIGAKVFISFTELLSSSFTAAVNKKHSTAREYGLYELKTDAEIDLAFNNGVISQSERVEYKADTDNLDRRLELGQITQNEYNKRKYWSYDGTNILGVLSPYGNQTDNQNVDTSDGVVKGRVSGKTRKGRKSTSTSAFPAYSLAWGNLYPIYLRYIPSINTRGMWWLSERLAYETLPQRPVAFEANATMPQPTVSGYKIVSINAQAAVASATITETTNNSGAVRFAPVPMYATAQLVNLGKTINPGVATASASLQTNIRIVTSAEDDVILYIMHEDPILYIREDAIK